MIDDNEIRLLSRAARFHDMALLIHGAAIAETVVGRRGNERPDRGVFLDFSQLRAIAADRPVPPFANGMQIVRQRVHRQLSGHSIQPMHAKIIGTAFEQSRCYRPANSFCD